jgi:hypothetical protein
LAAKETNVRTTPELPTREALGEVSRYKVCWRRGDSPHQPFAAFEGDLALSQAREFYEELLADPEVTELQFARLAGALWEWHVPPLRRNDKGEWEPD